MNPNKIVKLLEELSKIDFKVYNEKLLAFSKLKDWEYEMTSELRAKIAEYEKTDEEFDKSIAELADFKANGCSLAEFIELRKEVIGLKEYIATLEKSRKFHADDADRFAEAFREQKVRADSAEERAVRADAAEKRARELRNILLELVPRAISVNDFAESSVSFYNSDNENRKHAVQSCREFIKKVQKHI